MLTYIHVSVLFADLCFVSTNIIFQFVVCVRFFYFKFSYSYGESIDLNDTILLIGLPRPVGYLLLWPLGIILLQVWAKCGIQIFSSIVISTIWVINYTNCFHCSLDFLTYWPAAAWSLQLQSPGLMSNPPLIICMVLILQLVS